MKKRILFILNLPPPVYGANIVGEFVKNSSLINNAFECDFINLTTAKDIKNTNKGGLKKIIICLQLYIKILISTIKKKHDLYYLTINSKGSGFYKDFIVVVILKLFRTKIVYHYHNKGVKKGQNKRLLNMAYRFQFRNSEAILLSSLLYQDIEKYLPLDKVHICPNGVPEIAGINLERLNVRRTSEAPPQLLFLSNLMVEKGVYVLLEACKILFLQNIKFKVNFIGSSVDITETQFYDYVSEHNLEDCVSYKGKKYGSDKILYLENASIFILPTFYHNEAFPLVILEAMQYALPTISTNEGGIPDMISENETGYLIKNAEELSEKIKYLIENPDLRRKMGNNAKTKFEGNFRLDIFEKCFINTLKTIIDKT